MDYSPNRTGTYSEAVTGDQEAKKHNSSHPSGIKDIHG